MKRKKKKVKPKSEEIRGGVRVKTLQVLSVINIVSGLVLVLMNRLTAGPCCILMSREKSHKIKSFNVGKQISIFSFVYEIHV